MPKLLGVGHTYRIHPYKGIGRIPKGYQPNSDANKRLLLDQLPRLLRGYAATPNSGYIIIVCDLDQRDKQQFLSELHKMLEACLVKPETRFCIAVEEFEAWYLGDLQAVYKAYPKAKKDILHSYVNDAICGTWEKLADAVYNGGHKALAKKGWKAVGTEKSIWAITISPHMHVEENASPSFNFFRSQLLNVIT